MMFGSKSGLDTMARILPVLTSVRRMAPLSPPSASSADFWIRRCRDFFCGQPHRPFFLWVKYPNEPNNNWHKPRFHSSQNLHNRPHGQTILRTDKLSSPSRLHPFPFLLKQSRPPHRCFRVYSAPEKSFGADYNCCSSAPCGVGRNNSRCEKQEPETAKERGSLSLQSDQKISSSHFWKEWYNIAKW